MRLQHWMYGVIYFALVFTAGFILGTIRVLVLEPEIGARYAELLEMPVMLLVIYLAARFVVSKMVPIRTGMPYIILGVVALALLLLVEFTLVLGLQGISISQYLDSRDEIAFSAYLLSLLIFALMPWIIHARKITPDT